jgi:hypothetical protein
METSADPHDDPHSIIHRLDFSPGHAFRIKVRDSFATPVNPLSASSGFSLVASFGRSILISRSKMLVSHYHLVWVLRLTNFVYHLYVEEFSYLMCAQRRLASSLPK